MENLAAGGAYYPYSYRISTRHHIMCYENDVIDVDLDIDLDVDLDVDSNLDLNSNLLLF